MKRKSNRKNQTINPLDALLQEYEKLSREIKSQEIAIQAYEKIDHMLSIEDIKQNKKSLLLTMLSKLAVLGQNALTKYKLRTQNLNKTNKVLEEENSRLATNFKRLKHEFQRQIGVLPKAMRASIDKKGNTKTTSSSNDMNSTAREKCCKSRKRGAPKGHRGNTRKIPLNIDTQKEIQCPSQCICGCNDILESKQSDSRYVEDILPICSHITEIVYKRGVCHKCGSMIRHKDVLSGPPVSIGPNLSAHLIMLRQMGITYRKLSYFCTETLGIPLSPSGVLGVVNRCAEKLRPANEEILCKLREQSVVNADETGWPVSNKSVYIWGFFNTSLAYFHSNKSRGAKVPKEILGENFKGIVLCDFYASYNFLQRKQRCWIHLLRDIANERKIFPASISLSKFETRMWAVLNKGLDITKLENSVMKTKAIKSFDKELLSISKMRLPTGKASTLAKRISKHFQDMRRFILEPGVEYHNNRAERQLRPLVIARKNSFGSNTEIGAERNCIIYSVIETCRLNMIKPIVWLKKLLTTPDIIPPSLFLSK